MICSSPVDKRLLDRVGSGLLKRQETYQQDDDVMYGRDVIDGLDAEKRSLDEIGSSIFEKRNVRKLLKCAFLSVCCVITGVKAQRGAAKSDPN